MACNFTGSQPDMRSSRGPVPWITCGALQYEVEDAVQEVMKEALCAIQVADGEANINVFDQNRIIFRLGRAMTMELRGSSCFDFAMYRERSQDLPPNMSDEQIWDHFVHDGQFEGRPFRCLPPRTSPLLCSSTSHSPQCYYLNVWKICILYTAYEVCNP